VPDFAMVLRERMRKGRLPVRPDRSCRRVAPQRPCREIGCSRTSEFPGVAGKGQRIQS